MAGSSKRKRQDLQDDYSGGIEDEMTKAMHGSKKRHTLDSDSEEENGEDYNKLKHSVLRDEDIEGQVYREEEIDYDGETKITPFNMKDEMEEGYFDGHGTYVWNKRDRSEIKDSWLDSVDWMKLKKETTKEKGDRTKANLNSFGSDSDSSQDGLSLSDKAFTTPFYRECLTYMKPGETILKAIKRHGGSKTLSASERLKQKKLAKRSGEQSSSVTSVDVPMENAQDPVSLITEIANKFIGLGDMDFYQETYESLSHKIECFNNASSPISAPRVTETDVGLDMFSAD